MRPLHALGILPLLGCPDYTLKGRVEDPGTGSDSAAPQDDETPQDSEDSASPDPDPADTGSPETGEPPDPEICDGEDNDGDGEVDEGFPDTDGDGIVDCLELTYTIDLAITVDDVWEGWVDGSILTEERPGWNVLDEYSLTLDSGPHTIAVHGWDTGRAISGHLSSVAIDGVVQFVTGDGSWRVQANEVPEDWMERDFDHSAWMVPVTCIDPSPWGAWSASPMDHGATWTWYEAAGNCRDPSAYGHAYYRLSFHLP
jgi:hypothetical protein